MCVELEIVLQHQLKNNVDREDVLVLVGAETDLLNLHSYSFPWCGLLVVNCILMHLLYEVGPRVADVWDIAVVGNVIDQQTDVVVGCLIGVVVVELGKSV